jgi:hypothetical protein
VRNRTRDRTPLPAGSPHRTKDRRPYGECTERWASARSNDPLFPGGRPTVPLAARMDRTARRPLRERADHARARNGQHPGQGPDRTGRYSTELLRSSDATLASDDAGQSFASAFFDTEEVWLWGLQVSTVSSSFAR